MSCTLCKPVIEKQVKNQEEVKKIDIDYIIDSVIVEFNPSLLTKKKIKTAWKNLDRC